LLHKIQWRKHYLANVFKFKLTWDYFHGKMEVEVFQLETLQITSKLQLNIENTYIS